MTLETDTVVQVLLRERPRVTALAAALVRDVHAADDIFQQVILAALKAGRFRDRDHLIAWAVRAARHRAIDLARRRRVVSLPDDVLDLLESDWADPAPAGWSDRVEALRRCVGRLADPARDLLVMRYSDGLSVPDIAARLRRTADAVYQALSRTHRALRRCVENEFGRVENPVGNEATP